MRKKTYRVQNAQTGEVLAEGYAEDCARKVGCHKDTLRRSNFRDPEYITPRQQFLVTVLDDQNNSWPDAAKKWDEFCEPLRKKYGIEVKRWP